MLRWTLKKWGVRKTVDGSVLGSFKLYARHPVVIN
jgi:hypothetical protein